MDPWFLTKIQRLVKLESTLRANWKWFRPFEALNEEAQALLTQAKHNGFADKHIADVLAVQEAQVRGWVRGLELAPVYKMVDTCAAEFEAATPYFYSCYEDEGEG